MDVLKFLEVGWPAYGPTLLIITIALPALIVVFAPRVGFFWMWRSHQPIRGGVAGEAQVVAVSASFGRAVFESCAMNLIIRAPGVPPRAELFRGQVRVARWPNPGQVLPVSVDPSNPRRFRIMWGKVPKAATMGRLAAEALASTQRADPPGTSTAQGIPLNGLFGGAFGGAPINVEREVTIVGDVSKMTDAQREQLRSLGIDPDKLGGGNPPS